MIKKNTGTNKRFFVPNRSYFNRQLNKLMLVLFTLLIILIIKMINNKTTNSVIQIIQKNIYYDFSFKEDGKKVKDYILKAVDDSKDTIEKLAVDINKKYK